MSEKIPNRPYVDGKPLEGPLPFLEPITIVDAGILGGIAPDYWENTKLTTQQLNDLAIFRETYPVDLDTEDGGIVYPDGALEYSDQQLQLARERDEQESLAKRRNFGKEIISRLIPGARRA